MDMVWNEIKDRTNKWDKLTDVVVENVKIKDRTQSITERDCVKNKKEKIWNVRRLNGKG